MRSAHHVGRTTTPGGDSTRNPPHAPTHCFHDPPTFAGVRFSKLHVGLSIQRRHEYYVMNAVTPFFLFVTFSFLSFGPTDGDQGLGGAGLTDKTQITLSMVLTAAAFKIALASFTPKVRCCLGRQSVLLSLAGARARFGQRGLV